jgi:hypothetical protein
VVEAPDTVRLARWVHRILLTGVLAAGLLLAIGLAVGVATGNPRPIGPPAPIQSLPARLGAGDGVAMIELGLLVLVLTPCMRVVVLAIGWGFAGDHRHSAVAAIVLALLGLSVWLGLG